MQLDYYSILQVQPSASAYDIQMAYRRMAIRWHPDHNPGIDTNDMMQKINVAKSILLDPIKRRDYDRLYFHEHFALQEFQNTFTNIKERVYRVKVENCFMYNQYTNAIYCKNDFELIDALRRSNNYQSQFIDMVIVELHEIRNYSLSELKVMLNTCSFESEVAGSHKMFWKIYWMIYLVLFIVRLLNGN